MTILRVGTQSCDCELDSHDPKLIVLTGGPGAGKTAFLEIAARSLCSHVAILPEAASIVFDAAFPLHASDAGRRAAQRAIYHIQREVERLVLEERHVAVALCDRGTLDGAAYWPNGSSEYWRDLDTNLQEELNRYRTVVHLETPRPGRDRMSSHLRKIFLGEALRKDERIAEIWADHPRRITISSRTDFLSKAIGALEVVRSELPRCCHSGEFSRAGVAEAMVGGRK